MLLHFLDSADEDLIDIALYLDMQGAAPGVPEAFVDDIRQRCRRLAELSGTLGTERADLRAGLRSTPHGNYIILFRYAADTVEIVNVLHASRDVARQFDDEA